jgi:hypothetical protein
MFDGVELCTMMRGRGGGEQKCTKMDEIGEGELRGRIKEGLGMDLCWIGHFMGEKTTTN